MATPARLVELCRTGPVVVCPLVTPLTPTQGLDPVALQAQLERVAPHVDALMLLGTTGELATLDPRVADNLVDRVLAAEPPVPVVLGVGGAGLAQTLDHLDRVRHGVDCVAVCAPYYYDVDEADLTRYFVAVAEVSAVPVLLYNIPQQTRNPLSARVVKDLATHANIIGLKDSWPDPEAFARLLACADDSFFVLRGTDELHSADYLDQGVAGFVAGLENVVPGLMRGLIRDWSIGRVEDVHAHYDVLRPLLDVIGRHGGLRVVKHAVEHLVGSGGSPALPTQRLAAHAAAETEAVVMAAIDNRVPTATSW